MDRRERSHLWARPGGGRERARTGSYAPSTIYGSPSPGPCHLASRATSRATPRAASRQAPTRPGLPRPSTASRAGLSTPASAAGSRTAPVTPSSPHVSSAFRQHQHAGRNSRSQLGSDEEQFDDQDLASDVILALELKQNGAIGSAYFTAFDGGLFIQQDTIAGLELVEMLLLHVEPTVVIVSNRASDELITYLERHGQDVEGNNQNSNLKTAYALRNTGSSEFDPQATVGKLLRLHLDFLGHPALVMATAGEDEMKVDGHDGAYLGSNQARCLKLGALINLESQISLGCAGAVMNELRRRRASEFLPEDPNGAFAHNIRSVTMFDLSNSMFVNEDTLNALQTLRSEFHPNNQMNGPDISKSSAKESLSVYGLFQKQTSTIQGKVKLRQMFLRPSTDLELIGERHRTVAVLNSPGNSEGLVQIMKLLRRIQNMKTILGHVHKGVDKPSEKTSLKRGVWSSLQRFAKCTVELYELVNSLSGADMLEIVAKMRLHINTQSLREVGEMVARTVDFEDSEASNRTVVLRQANRELEQMKRIWDGLHDYLTLAASGLAHQVPEWARRYVTRCIFYPQLGFLTCVEMSEETGRPSYEGEGLVNDFWERKFVHQDTFYFKNNHMRSLDWDMGDTYSKIIDMEIEILNELRKDILAREEAILQASDFWGELDCLVALASVARHYNLIEPRMTGSNVIEIRGGRHLLQELVVPSFVANDCSLTGGRKHEGRGDSSEATTHSCGTLSDAAVAPSMLILTGPNHSGKSVYLKQVALIVYLAHIGSFVPAEEATIGVVDKILTRVSTRESAAGAESAFAIDMRQAAFSINLATGRSLVLIDEFGKGTSPVDGAALAAALLEHFAGRKAEDRPKVLAATHFHEIFEHGFLSSSGGSPSPSSAGGGTPLAFAHMDIRVDYDSDKQDDQVTFLYRLVPGRNTSSFGSKCAAMNGIDRKVVERAEALGLLMARGEDLEAVCAKLSREEERALEKAEAVARALVGADLPESSGHRKGSGRVGVSAGRSEGATAGVSIRDVLSGILDLAESDSSDAAFTREDSLELS